MKFLFLFLICPLCLAAQPGTTSPKQIVGVWKGYIITTDVKVPYELVFSEENGKIAGWSYTTFTVGGEEIVTMKKLAVKIDGLVVTEDDNDVYNNFPKAQLKKIKQINTLLLEESTASSKLTGTFETITPRSLKPAKGNVFLEKKNTPDSSRLLAKMDELGLTRPLILAYNAAPVQEPEEAIVAVTAKPVLEKSIVPPAIPKVSDRDTVKTFDVAKAITPSPVDVAVIPTTPVKKINPDGDNKSTVVATVPIKPNVIVPEKAIAKTTPQVIPAKPRRDTIYARPQTPVPVASAKVEKPVVKKIPPPDALVKVVPINLPDNIAIAPAIDLRNRKIEIIDELIIMADSLQFTLYDNGEVDGDTVSIILNGKTIVFRQGLSTRPFTKTIYLTRDMGDSVQLIMYAENLGTIAPNTGLMIVNYDNKRREIRFSGDLSKNAAITLRRKEKE